MAAQARGLVLLKSKGQSQRTRKPLELPTEILGKIFDLITSKDDLRIIALCSRQFNGVVATRLYKSIYINAGTHKYKDQNSPKEDPLREVVLHLLHRRNFSPFVRNVRLCGPTGDDYDYQNGFGSVEDTTLRTAVQRYLRRPENTSTKLAQVGTSWLSFDLDDRTTVPVLFVALLPRLTTLHIQVPDERLLADSFLSLNVFLGLEQLTLEWIPQQGRLLLSSITARHFKDLMSLKSLRKACIIRLASLSAYPYASLFQKLKPKMSSITHLELRESRLDSKDFGYILAATSPLETFTYEQSWHPSLGRRSIKPVILLMALQNQYEETLDSIWINFSIGYEKRTSYYQYMSFADAGLDCLSKFRTLKKLCLPMELLCSYSPAGMNDVARRCFPSSLETLVLIKHIQQGVCTLTDFAKDFFAHWQETRMNVDNIYIPHMKTAVFIAYFDQYLSSSISLLDQIEAIQDLEVVLAMDECFGGDTVIGDASNERVQEIADSMGLTRYGKKRWKAVDTNALRRLLAHHNSMVAG